MNRFDTSWFAIKPIDGIFYYPSWMEVAILLGVFSGVLLIYTIIAHFLPVFAETVPDDAECLEKDQKLVEMETAGASAGD